MGGGVVVQMGGNTPPPSGGGGVNKSLCICMYMRVCGLVFWGLTPQQQPGSYQGGKMMMMKSVFWWRKPEYPEETTDIWQVTDETFHTYEAQSRD